MQVAKLLPRPLPLLPRPLPRLRPPLLLPLLLPLLPLRNLVGAESIIEFLETACPNCRRRSPDVLAFQV